MFILSFSGEKPSSVSWKNVLDFLYFMVLMSVPLLGEVAPIEYEDYFGHHTLKSPPKKVVYLSTQIEVPSMLDIWDYVVGISEYGFMNDIVQRTAPIARLEHFPSNHDAGIQVERLQSLGVDLVVTYPANLKGIEFAKRFGINFLAFRTQSLDELIQDISTQAKIFGREEMARPRILRMQKTLEEIQTHLDCKRERKVKVMEVFYKANQVSGVKSLDSDILRYAGVDNLGERYIKSGRGEVNLENILKENPSVIFLWWLSPLEVEDILQNPLLRSVDAIKNQQVFKLPRFDIASPRAPLISLFVSMKSYPECFKDIDFDLYQREYEKEVFGLRE